jgi:RHH-type transcriptional regulator, rel operon repressor / antitoxin RelB
MPISIRLDPALEQRIDTLANDTHRSKAFYLRELISNGLDDLEDAYSASQVMQRVRQGTEKTFTDAQIRADLGV